MLILEFLEKYNHAQGVFASTGAGTLSAEDLREFARDISETFGTGNFKGSWIEGAMQAGEYWISGNKIWKTKQAFNSATAPTQANAYWSLELDPPVYTDQQAISAAKSNIGTAAGTFADGAALEALAQAVAEFQTHTQNTDTGTNSRNFQIGQGTAGNTSTFEAAGTENDIAAVIKPKGNAYFLLDGVNYLPSAAEILELTPAGEVRKSGFKVTDFTVPSAFGEVYFVSPVGNNSTGTRGRIDKPFLTLQAAFDNAITLAGAGQHSASYVMFGGTFAGISNPTEKPGGINICLLSGAKISGNLAIAAMEVIVTSDGTGEIQGDINTQGQKLKVLNLKKFTGNVRQAGAGSLVNNIQEFIGTFDSGIYGSSAITNCRKVTLVSDANKIMTGTLSLFNIDLCVCGAIGFGGSPLGINARRVNFEYGVNVLEDTRYKGGYFFDCNFKQTAPGVSFISCFLAGGGEKVVANHCNFYTDVPVFRVPGGYIVEIDYCRSNTTPLHELSLVTGAPVELVGDFNRVNSNYTVGY